MIIPEVIALSITESKFSFLGSFSNQRGAASRFTCDYLRCLLFVQPHVDPPAHIFPVSFHLLCTNPCLQSVSQSMFLILEYWFRQLYHPERMSLIFRAPILSESNIVLFFLREEDVCLLTTMGTKDHRRSNSNLGCFVSTAHRARSCVAR